MGQGRRQGRGPRARGASTRSAAREDLSGGDGLFDFGRRGQDDLVEMNDDAADKVHDLADDLDDEADELIALSEKNDVDHDKIGAQLEKVGRLADELEIELSRLDAFRSEIDAQGIERSLPDARRQDVAVPK
jgi:hypothetical protein